MTGQLVVGCISAHVDPLTRRETPRTTLQLRAAKLLERSDLAPTTMPPSAILIVRRLADPLPHSLALHRERASSAAWERAVSNEIGSLYRQASRPQRGKIASTANAVLFADEAELVACLALDLCQGVAGMHWWWKTLLRQQSQPSAAALLMRHAQQIPGIFDLLDRWGRGVEVVRSFGAGETTALLTALLAAFQLTDFRALLPSAPPGVRAARRAQEAQAIGVSTESSPQHGESPAEVTTEPWTEWLSQARSPALGAGQIALLGTALSLYRNGINVRGQGFAAAAAVWWQAVHADVAARPSKTDSRSIGGTVSQWPASGGVREAGEPMQAGENPVQIWITANPPDNPPGARPTLHPAASASELVLYSGLQDSTGAAHAATARTNPRPAQIGAMTEETSNCEQLPDRQAGQYEEPDLGQGMVTDLGGVLYLINVMVRLGLPDCFDESWELASRAGPWAVLEILARGLLNETDSLYLSDPLWRALAKLDGREPETVAGQGLSPHDVCRLPTGLDATVPVLASDNDCGVLTALTRALKPAARQWLALVLPSLRGWLRQTLETESGVEDAVIVQQLLCRHGRLFVTTTHIDLVLSLGQIWIPVRLAGLDQDPGWLPRWGRVVQFHFREKA